MLNRFFVLLFILPLSTFGQSFLFEHYSQETGLSQGTGYAIAQYDDFRWFGTQEGLNRFDGYGFKIFRAEGKNTLNSSFVQALCPDSKGRFWIGTGGGVNLYNKQTETFERFSTIYKAKHKIDSVSIKKIFEDSKHNIWIMTEEKGLFCFNPDSRKMDSYLLNDKTLFDFCFTPNGTLWVSSYNEIYYFDSPKKQFIQANLQQKINKKTLFRGLTSDKVGNLWIGTHEDGVYVINPAESKIIHYQAGNAPQNLSSNEITCLMTDKSGKIWIGTRTGGISVYNPDIQTFTQVKQNKYDSRTLAENNVWQLYQDKQGIVWVGLSSKGIDKYDPLKFQFGLIQKTTAQSNNSLSDNMIFRLFGNDNNLYIGTESGGVARYSISNQQFLPFLENTKDPTNSLTKEVRNILTDSKNNLWIANWKGLCRIDEKNNVVKSYPLLEQPKIQYLFDAKLIKNANHSEEIWVGGEETFKRFDLNAKQWKDWKEIPALAAISNYTIRSIYQDQDLNVWLGTLEHGLIYYNSKSQKTIIFDAKLGLNCANIRSFCEDNHTLWVGSDCGLFEINLRTLKVEHQYSTANGLPNNVMYGILKDNNFLWLSSNKGLTKFLPRKGVVRNYDQDDGLQSNEFNTGCAYKHADGTLFFGGVNGINYFKTNDLNENNFIPPIKITKIMVLDSIYPTNQKNIVLRSDQNFIEVEFRALNFSNSHKNQYQYQLEGIDTNWVNVQNRNTVNYTKLPPGDYVFKVKGGNNDGRWNENPAAVKIRIEPPFWGTLWFRLVLIGLLLSGLYGVYNYQVFQLKARQEHDINVVMETQELERQRFAKELHDGVGANLSMLKMYLSSMGDKNFPIETLKERSSLLLKQTLDEIKGFIHDMHPRSLNELGLERTIWETVEHVNQSKHLKVVFKSQNIPQKLSQNIEINLFRVVQELIQNAIKHSKASEVFLDLRFENQVLSLKYDDNGKGFDTTLIENRGNGLLNMQQRIELLKGTFIVSSSPNQGTTVSIAVKIESSV